jgi:GNAT superfamily N-acetyltransferase
MTSISLRTNPVLTDAGLNALFARSWPEHRARPFTPVLARSLCYVAAFDADRLIGFVNVATDGGAHAFLLDVTVDPDYRRQGTGTALVRAAISITAETHCEWLHVDYEASRTSFYRACGFTPTSAGLVRLRRAV